MPNIKITCPHCGKTTQFGKRPPDGKKIECPKCDESFVPGQDDEGEGQPGKEKKSSSKMTMIVGCLVLVLGGGAAVSVGLCAVGAWVWPGFLLAKIDMVAFVPPEANVIVGGNPKLLHGKTSHFEKLLQQIANVEVLAEKKTDMEQLILNSERMLAFANSNEANAKMVWMFQSNAADIAKLKHSSNVEVGQTVGGHRNVHKASEDGKKRGVPAYVAFPGNHVVIATDIDEKALIEVLDRGGKPAKTNAALELSKAVDKAPLWVSFISSAQTRDKLRKGIEKGAGVPKDLLNAAAAIDGVKGITLVFDTAGGNGVSLDFNVHCKNAADAANVRAGAEVLFAAYVKAVRKLMNEPRLDVGQIPFRILDDLNSATFTTKDAVATLNLNVCADTTQDLIRIGAEKKFAILAWQLPDNIVNPKGGGPNLNYKIPNLVKQMKNERVFNFTPGKRVIVTLGVEFPPGRFGKVELHVLRGLVGENALAGPNHNLNFITPQDEVNYRVRVSNFGPDTPTTCIVSVVEFP